jgi:hypothetical protein
MSTTEDDSDDNRKPAAIKKTQNKTNKIKKSGLSKKQQIELIQQQLAALLQAKDDSDDEDDDDDVQENEGEYDDVQENEGEDKDDDINDDDDDNEDYNENTTITKVSAKIDTDSNNNVTIIKYGNNEYKTIQHDDRLEVKISWLESGYAWKELDADYYDAAKKKKKIHLKTIPYDMFPDDNVITREYGVRYFKHLNNNTEPTESDIQNTIETVSSLRDRYKAYIMEIIYKFWFDISTKIGICSPTGLKIRDNKSLVKAFCLIDNEHDLHKIVFVLHIVFDWFDNYHKCIMDLLEIKFPIQMLNVPKITNQHSSFHCIHLLITKVIAQERKTINNNLKKAIGIKVYVTREKEQCCKLDENGKKILVLHPIRNRYCIYPWMIRGTFVSNNLH